MIQRVLDGIVEREVALNEVGGRVQLYFSIPEDNVKEVWVTKSLNTEGKYDITVLYGS